MIKLFKKVVSFLSTALVIVYLIFWVFSIFGIFPIYISDNEFDEMTENRQDCWPPQ